MKKLLYILCFLPLWVAGQSSKMAGPNGSYISISPGTTITQASPATVFYSETIPANQFMPNKWYKLFMAFKLTTPTLGIPALTITIKYGTQTYALTSNANLIGGLSNQLFTLSFWMISTGINSQIPFAEVRQPNGNVIALTTATATPVGAFTVNSAVAQPFSVTIQFTGASLGTSSLNNFWVFRDAF